MKQKIVEVANRLTLLPIDKIESFDGFSNEYVEYSVFLKEEARNYERLNISRTHLLVDTQGNRILAYMSLISDSVQLTGIEKGFVMLGGVPFSTFPALKIGKLAVDTEAKTAYSGIGSMMIKLARGFAATMNDTGIACRFLTIDADVENNPGVTAFYTKNGFVPNERINNKKRLTISMRKDIFIDETI